MMNEEFHFWVNGSFTHFFFLSLKPEQHWFSLCHIITSDPYSVMLTYQHQQEAVWRENYITCRSQKPRLGSPLKGCRHNSSDLDGPSLHVLDELINKR